MKREEKREREREEKREREREEKRERKREYEGGGRMRERRRIVEERR